MHILIPLFSPPTGTFGSLTRVLAIHKAAVDRGHEVAFTASGTLAERLEELKCHVFRTPEASLLGLPLPISHWLAKHATNATPPVSPGKSFGSIWLVLWFTGVTNQHYLRKLVDAELAAVDQFKPQFLFTEMDPGAFVVSRITGVPIACTYASVMNIGIGTFPWRRLRDSQAQILQEHRLEPVEPHAMLNDSHTVRIIPSIQDLEEDLKPSNNVVYVGSLLHSFRTSLEQKFKPEPGKRYIFVYVGTGSISLETIRVILPKVFPEGSQTLCLVSTQGVQEEERYGNVILRPFWDAESLIPHCSWVLCHGGHNTIIQSLVHGIPLLLFPGPIFERRFNARMVEMTGAGHFGELPQFNQDWLTNSMTDHDICAAHAGELGQKIKKLGGAKAAIDIMEQKLDEPQEALDKISSMG